MIKAKDLRWQKVYEGAFSAELADALVEEIRKIANPETNGIYWANKRRRRNSKKYDVYIQKVKLSTRENGDGLV